MLKEAYDAHDVLTAADWLRREYDGSSLDFGVRLTFGDHEHISICAESTDDTVFFSRTVPSDIVAKPCRELTSAFGLPMKYFGNWKTNRVTGTLFKLSLPICPLKVELPRQTAQS